MSNTRPQAEDLGVHAEFLRRLAQMLLRSPDLADDAVQETMLIAWRKRPQGPHPRGWMAGTLRNVARNLRRASRRRQKYEDHTPGPHGLAPEAMRARERTRKQLLDVVLTLPDEQREAILLRFDRGWPPRRIATEMALPVHTVHNRIRAGLVTCRAELERRLGRETDMNGGWRGALVALVPTLPPPTVATLTIGGLVVPKTLTLSACALVLLVAGFVLLRPTSEADPVPTRTDGAATVDEASAPGTTQAPSLQGTDARADASPLEPSSHSPHLHGRVIDQARGGPIVGARVRAYDYGNARWLESRTNQDGTFAFEETTNSSHAFHLTVLSEHHAPHTEARVMATRASHRLTLSAGGFLVGRVVVPEGRTAADLSVRPVARRARDANADPDLALLASLLPHEARTAPQTKVDPRDGSFRVGPLAAGEYALVCVQDGMPPQQLAPKDGRPSWEAGYAVTSGDETRVGTHVLDAIEAVRVKVLDAATESPLGRAVFTANDGRRLEATSLPDPGLFTVPARRTSRGALDLAFTVAARGFAPARASVMGDFVPQPHVVRVTRPGALEVAFMTSPKLSAPALALVRTSSGDVRAHRRISMPGTARFEDLPAGEALELLILAADASRRLHAMPFRLQAGETTYREIGGSGRPALYGVASRNGKPESRVLVVVDDASGTRTRIYTGVDGCFRFDGLPAGPRHSHSTSVSRSPWSNAKSKSGTRRATCR